MVRHRRSSVLTTTVVVLPDSSHYLLCCRRTGSWLVSMFRGDVRANRGGARATGWGVGASDFLGLCQSLAFAPRRGSVRHTRITSQRGFRRRGCSMAAGEAVRLGIFTDLISLGLSRFLDTPTFPTFSSRDVEGGLAAVASPPSSPKSPISPRR